MGLGRKNSGSIIVRSWFPKAVIVRVLKVDIVMKLQGVQLNGEFCGVAK